MDRMIERGADAMRKRRRELIAEPLDRIWPELMRAAIEAMRPTNGQIKSAVDHWLSEGEGFSLRAERVPPDALSWIYHAAYVGVGSVFPPDAALSEPPSSTEGAS